MAIGRAMITDPTVILADEPSGNLDTANSRRLCELMHRLCQQRGRTVITVTHDPAVAMWAQRVMVLQDGRIVETIDTATASSPRELADRFQVILAAGQSREGGACA